MAGKRFWKPSFQSELKTGRVFASDFWPDRQNSQKNRQKSSPFAVFSPPGGLTILPAILVLGLSGQDWSIRMRLVMRRLEISCPVLVDLLGGFVMRIAMRRAMRGVCERKPKLLDHALWSVVDVSAFGSCDPKG